MRALLTRIASLFADAPGLLVIVLLNVAMIAAATWYLMGVEDFRHQERIEVLRLMSTQCGPRTRSTDRIRSWWTREP